MFPVQSYVHFQPDWFGDYGKAIIHYNKQPRYVLYIIFHVLFHVPFPFHDYNVTTAAQTTKKTPKTEVHKQLGYGHIF